MSLDRAGLKASQSLAEKVKAKKELQCSNDKVILLFAKTQKMMR